MEIICTHLGHQSYEQLLGPILDDPDPRIWADAEIDMSRHVQQDPHKLWWIAVDLGEVLAWCAAWLQDDGRTVECGHNYECHGLGREAQAYRAVFWTRQTWLQIGRRRAVTWIFDQPLALHEQAGWQRTGDQDDSEHGHHWQQLRWTPAS